VRDDVMRYLVFAGRCPHAARGAKKVINHLSNDRAKKHFALEREIIFKLIGSPNQVEAITANFEKREPKFGDEGRKVSLFANSSARHRTGHSHINAFRVTWNSSIESVLLTAAGITT
jgi:hypothetical protein